MQTFPPRSPLRPFRLSANYILLAAAARERGHSVRIMAPRTDRNSLPWEESVEDSIFIRTRALNYRHDEPVVQVGYPGVVDLLQDVLPLADHSELEEPRQVEEGAEDYDAEDHDPRGVPVVAAAAAAATAPRRPARPAAAAPAGVAVLPCRPPPPPRVPVVVARDAHRSQPLEGQSHRG